MIERGRQLLQTNDKYADDIRPESSLSTTSSLSLQQQVSTGSASTSHRMSSGSATTTHRMSTGSATTSQRLSSGNITLTQQMRPDNAASSQQMCPSNAIPNLLQAVQGLSLHSKSNTSPTPSGAEEIERRIDSLLIAVQVSYSTLFG